MATKRSNLFLYLALACFVGLLVIFFVDGYMGIYDTFHIKTGERERTIEPERWLHHSYIKHIRADWGDKVFFHYKIDNRRFSTYSTPIEASVWKENEKVLTLFSKEKSIGSFDEASMEWTLDSEQLRLYISKQHEEFTVNIKRKGAERKMILHYHGELPPPGLKQKMRLKE